VAYANIFPLKSKVHLQLRTVADNSSGQDLPASGIARELRDIYFVIADIKNSV